MPGETVGTVHVDQLLTNLAILYRPLEAGLIADTVCPRVPVKKESDLYAVFNQGDFYGTEVDDLVADKTEPSEIEFGHTTAGYRAQRRELAWSISDRERSNADDQLRLEQTRQEGTLLRLLVKRERRVALILKKIVAGAPGQLVLGAARAAVWSTAATTTIETDIWTGREAIRKAIGIRPNIIVIPEAVAAAMCKNTQLTAKLQYTYGDSGARPLLEEYYPVLPPTLFGMRVLIPGVIYNTAKEGATASYSDIWGDDVRLLYVTSGPDLENPSVAYSFQSEPLTTRTWREDNKRLDKYAVGMTVCEQVVASSAAYEISACIT